MTIGNGGVIELFLWIVFGYTVAIVPAIYGMAIGEYIGHRWVLHRRLRYFRSKPWRALNPMIRLHNNHNWKQHHVEHHCQRLNQPVARYIDLQSYYHLATASPLLAILLYRGYQGHVQAFGMVLAIVTVLVGHSLVWNSIHRAIHGAENSWTAHQRWFPKFAHHHLAHHRNHRVCYAVVFIGGLLSTDRWFGTRRHK